MQKFLNWVSKHYKGLLIGGITASSTASIVASVAEYRLCRKATSSVSNTEKECFENRENEKAMESDPVVEEHSEM